MPPILYSHQTQKNRVVIQEDKEQTKAKKAAIEEAIKQFEQIHECKNYNNYEEGFKKILNDCASKYNCLSAKEKRLVDSAVRNATEHYLKDNKIDNYIESVVLNFYCAILSSKSQIDEMEDKEEKEILSKTWAKTVQNMAGGKPNIFNSIIDIIKICFRFNGPENILQNIVSYMNDGLLPEERRGLRALFLRNNEPLIKDKLDILAFEKLESDPKLLINEATHAISTEDDALVAKQLLQRALQDSTPEGKNKILDIIINDAFYTIKDDEKASDFLASALLAIKDNFSCEHEDKVKKADKHIKDFLEKILCHEDNKQNNKLPYIWDTLNKAIDTEKNESKKIIIQDILNLMTKTLLEKLNSWQDLDQKTTKEKHHDNTINTKISDKVFNTFFNNARFLAKFITSKAFVCAPEEKIEYMKNFIEHLVGYDDSVVPQRSIYSCTKNTKTNKTKQFLSELVLRLIIDTNYDPLLIAEALSTNEILQFIFQKHGDSINTLIEKKVADLNSGQVKEKCTYIINDLTSNNITDSNKEKNFNIKTLLKPKRKKVADKAITFKTCKSPGDYKTVLFKIYVKKLIEKSKYGNANYVTGNNHKSNKSRLEQLKKELLGEKLKNKASEKYINIIQQVFDEIEKEQNLNTRK